MVLPQRAPVRPRVISPVTGDVVLLEEVVAEAIAGGRSGVLEIASPAGDGKSVALRHLAAVFQDDARVAFLDDAQDTPNLSPPARWVVFARARNQLATKTNLRLWLAPWDKDEWIEYLLAVHKGACASVMARLHAAPDLDFVGGSPALWRSVLDAMAQDSTLISPRHALQRFLDAQISGPNVRAGLAACSLAFLSGGAETAALVLLSLPELHSDAAAHRIMRHRPLILLLATSQILDELRSRSSSDHFRRHMPRDLVQCVAEAARCDPHLIGKLGLWVVKPELQAMAASVLHAAAAGWMPAAGTVCRLGGAYLAGARWPEIMLRQADLHEADLSGADLRQANLDEARAISASFAQADLHGAALVALRAEQADFAGANLANANALKATLDHACLVRANLEAADLRRVSLQHADLTGAMLRHAKLKQANLTDARCDGADFSHADLSYAKLRNLKLKDAILAGAVFVGADLVNADLEDLELNEADFQKANLSSALLTGSSMPRARFDNALLENAGLAEVNWEGVSLRGARMRGVSFHLGSTRSGLVGSPIACEGSRTGFYTDDYAAQDFKAPEEIRKANLRYADLRDADIGEVDFYLVDLRHAKFDPHHEPHLRRCGAILDQRR